MTRTRRQLRFGFLLLAALQGLISANLRVACGEEENETDTTPKPAAEAQEVRSDLRKVLTVVVTGVGLDYDGAKKDALKRALDQTVGTLVSAETIIQNRDVIRDKVLVANRADVDSVEDLKTWEEDGLHHVRVKVSVDAGQMIRKLRANDIAARQVAGESLYVAAKFKELNRENAKKILARALERYTPENLYRFTIDPIDPDDATIEDGLAKVSVTVHLTPNYAFWHDYRRELSTLLVRLGYPRVVGHTYITGRGTFFGHRGFRDFRFRNASQSALDNGEQSYWLFLPMSVRETEKEGRYFVSWEGFKVDKSFLELLRPFYRPHAKLRLRAVDSKDNVVSEVNHNERRSDYHVAIAFGCDSSWFKQTRFCLGPYLWTDFNIDAKPGLSASPDPYIFQLTVAADALKEELNLKADVIQVSGS